MHALGSPRSSFHTQRGNACRPLLVAALCAAVLAVAGLVAPAAVGAEPPPGGGGLTTGFRAGYDAVVGNTNTCGPAADEPCPYTHIHIRTPQDWDDPDVQEIVAVRIVDLVTRAPVSTGEPIFHTDRNAEGDRTFDAGAICSGPAYCTSSYISVDTTSLLAPGQYRVEASLERPAHWSCAVDNRPQCVGLPRLGWSGEWRFRYDGVTKVVQPMYQPATTALTHEFTRKGRYIISRGRVLTAVVDPVSFLLGPVRATPGARVKVWTLNAHRRWVYRKTVNTRADGTFRARVRQPTRTIIKVGVQPTSSYPSAGYATVYKR